MLFCPVGTSQARRKETLHALLKGASARGSLHGVWPRGHRDRRTELEEGGGCHRTLCSHVPSSSGWTGPWAAHLTPSSVTYHRTSQALPYHEHSVSSSVKRAVVPGRQSIAGTELTHSGNSQSSRPKGPDFPHLDSDRPAGHSKAITTIFFKMAHRKPGHPLPPARGSAQLGSLTAPALLLRLRRCTRGWGRNVPGAASFLKCILLSYGSPSSGPYPSYKLNLVVCWGPKRDQRFLP